MGSGGRWFFHLKITEINLKINLQFISHNPLPSIFDDMFVKNLDIHSYNTRQQEQFNIPKILSTKIKSSLAIQGTILWNHVLKFTNNICSLNIFKQQIKTLLLEDHEF